MIAVIDVPALEAEVEKLREENRALRAELVRMARIGRDVTPPGFRRFAPPADIEPGRVPLRRRRGPWSP